MTLELTGQQRLLVMHDRGGDMVQFLDRSGQLTLTVVLTEQGPVLRFEGAALKLQATGDLIIEAEHLALAGRSEVALHSGGDMHVHAERDLTSVARIQNIKADLGNVNVKANDDVCINGERVRVNCDEI
jgi:hypothetical protein